MPKNTTEPNSEEAYAYTPGLKVKEFEVVTKTRRLPLIGEVLVKQGQEVDFDTIVARTKIPGAPIMLRVADLLGVSTNDVPKFLTKKIGDKLQKDEIIAKYSPFWGLFKKEIKTSETCTLENYSSATGQCVLRCEPIPVDLVAYMKGKIKKILPNEGVIIENEAAYIQGIFGIGGERNGEIAIIAKSPDEIITPEMITTEHKGKILIGGSLATLEVLKKATEVGVKGIVVGGIRSVDITQYLGYEIGVAITGEENIPLSLIATEGFGEMRMSDKTFKLLSKFAGEKAAINGATQIRAGVLRPEIIIPIRKGTVIKKTEVSNETVKGMRPGTPIRIIADPYFGEIGIVSHLPVDLVKVETGALVRVVEIRLGNRNVVVPRANVEIIEE
ncbi:MAG: hypothetical protein ABSA11_14900 [Candidatus Bathyarchaeia archaeon]|jgi:hypothetical protein